MSDQKNDAENAPQDRNLMAALSYVWIVSVVMLILKKEDPFVAFHAKQGSVLFAASILLWFIPIVGWLLNLVVLVGMVVGFVKALSGEKYELPLVASIAKQINI
jgi:fumarate reductase subunit D